MDSKYSIKDARQQTGLSEFTLRYYEKVGLLSIDRLKNGHRFYSDRDIRWIQTLKLLKSTGLPIKEMQRLVHLTKQGDKSIDERIAYFRAYQDELRRQIAIRQNAIQIVERKIERHYELLRAYSKKNQ